MLLGSPASFITLAILAHLSHSMHVLSLSYEALMLIVFQLMKKFVMMLPLFPERYSKGHLRGHLLQRTSLDTNFQPSQIFSG